MAKALLALAAAVILALACSNPAGPGPGSTTDTIRDTMYILDTYSASLVSFYGTLSESIRSGDSWRVPTGRVMAGVSVYVRGGESAEWQAINTWEIGDSCVIISNGPGQDLAGYGYYITAVK